MMKYLIALFVLLIGMTVNADPLLTLDSLRVSVMREQGLPDSGSTGVTVAKVNFSINRAIWRVSDDMPAVERIDTIVTTADVDEYALPSDFLRLGRVIKFGKRVPEQAHEYFKTLFLTPLPVNNDDSLRVYYYASGEVLSSGTDTTDVLPAYREAIVVYANYLVSMLRKKYVDAQVYLKQYEGMKTGE